MPTENVNKADNLIDVGEADQQSTEINLDDKGEPEKVEAPKEEKIEVEQVEEPTKEVDKSFENEVKKPEVKAKVKQTKETKSSLTFGV